MPAENSKLWPFIPVSIGAKLQFLPIGWNPIKYCKFQLFKTAALWFIANYATKSKT